MEPRRREVITVMGIASITGCLDSNSSNQNNPSNTEEQNKFDCNANEQEPTENAIEKYQNHISSLGAIRGRIGNPNTIDHDTNSVFVSCDGSGVLQKITCDVNDEDTRDRVTEYLNAVRTFRGLKTDAENIKNGFSELNEFVDTCSVENQTLFEEQTNIGVEISDLYISSIEKFIETAETHAENEYQRFRPTENYESGLNYLDRAENKDIMSVSDLEVRVNVDTAN